MNRIEGMWFTRNRQNMRSFVKFWAAARARRHGSSQVTSAMGIPFLDFRGVVFEIGILSILLFLDRNENS